jgi:hypothetical protein
MVTNTNIIFKNKVWVVRWVDPVRKHEIQVTKMTYPMPSHGDTDYFIYDKGRVYGDYPQGWLPDHIKQKVLEAFKKARK